MPNASATVTPPARASPRIQACVHERTARRDEALHRYKRWEAVNGVLQVAVVLASVAIVTRLPLLARSGSVVGGLAVLFGVLVRAGLRERMGVGMAGAGAL